MRLGGVKVNKREKVSGVGVEVGQDRFEEPYLLLVVLN
jgi:hypothetical protein